MVMAEPQSTNHVVVKEEVEEEAPEALLTPTVELKVEHERFAFVDGGDGDANGRVDEDEGVDPLALPDDEDHIDIKHGMPEVVPSIEITQMTGDDSSFLGQAPEEMEPIIVPFPNQYRPAQANGGIRLKNMNSLMGSSSRQNMSAALMNANKKGFHTCIMAGVHSTDFGGQQKVCTARRPMKMSTTDMVMHYFIHYRDRGVWDSVIPPLTEEDKRRIDSYQCNICREKFRPRGGDDLEPSRATFIYHIAHKHGKLIEVMKNDNMIDMTSVLELLHATNANMRKYIDEGTDTMFDDSICKIIETPEWLLKVRHDLNIAKPVSSRVYNTTPSSNTMTVQRPTPVSVASTPPASAATADADQSDVIENPYFFCPLNINRSCKMLAHNNSAGTLKLHLFQHYIDYFKNSVPVLTDNTDLRCGTCGKRVPGANAEALRNSYACHLAIIHGELRDALDEDPNFPKYLIERLYDSGADGKPKVIYSKSRADAVRPAVAPRQVVVVSKQNSSERAQDSEADNTNESTASAVGRPVVQITPVPVSGRGRGRGRGRGAKAVAASNVRKSGRKKRSQPFYDMDNYQSDPDEPEAIGSAAKRPRRSKRSVLPTFNFSDYVGEDQMPGSEDPDYGYEDDEDIPFDENLATAFSQSLDEMIDEELQLEQEEADPMDQPEADNDDQENGNDEIVIEAPNGEEQSEDGSQENDDDENPPEAEEDESPSTNGGSLKIKIKQPVVRMERISNIESSAQSDQEEEAEEENEAEENENEENDNEENENEDNDNEENETEENETEENETEENEEDDD